MTAAALHDSPWNGVLYLTGGGSLLLSQLLTTPGASATVLESVIPYSFESLCELINETPEQACAESTARKMAMSAFIRARQLRTSADNFGFGLTASLGTNRPKRGEIRAHMAVQTLSTTRSFSMTIDRDLSRLQQEEAVTDICLAKLLSSLELQHADSYETEDTCDIAETELQQLVINEIEVLGEPANAFLCGAFNPVHEGHKQMKEVGEALLESPVKYELCVRNIDKAPLDYIEIAKRRAQFTPADLVLTNQPTFIEKARALAPQGGAKFLVGVDTLVRINDPDYYVNSTEFERALREFAERRDEFLVFGRLVAGRFQTLAELELHPILKPLCREVTEAQYRNDLSSTKLRATI